MQRTTKGKLSSVVSTTTCQSGAYPNTGKFWAQPNLSMRSIKQHQDDTARKTVTTKVPSEPPLAPVSAPPMLQANMADYGFDMWSEYNDHMTHQERKEVEDVDRAFQLEFFVSDALFL